MAKITQIYKLFLTFLRIFYETLQAGDLAPQFTLLNQDNQPVSLSDFKGKKVLVYFLSESLNTRLHNSSLRLRDAKMS